MNLLEKTKAKAKEIADKKAEEKAAEVRQLSHLEAALRLLSDKTMEALETLDGVKCKGGKLRILTSQDAWFGGTQYLAIIDLSKSRNCNQHLVFVKARIETGTRDYSDDCRNEPYTEATITFDSQPDSYAYKEQNRYFHYSASYNDQLDKALEALSEHLSDLFIK
jgi:hypothetical protein